MSVDQPDRISRRKRARQIVAARLERLEDISISKLVPSSITLLALGCGITAIRFAIDGKWEIAVSFIICAGILDMLDGRAARLLGADSRFGAQLDSLADLVSFGVAPWSSAPAAPSGWRASMSKACATKAPPRAIPISPACRRRRPPAWCCCRCLCRSSGTMLWCASHGFPWRYWR